MAYRYLGNKTRLLEWITGIIRQRVPIGARIADPMCGTAAVSEALARDGYSVSAGDALTFPVLHAKARLLFQEPPAFPQLGGYVAALARLNSLDAVQGYFYSEFSPEGAPSYGGPPRAYFTAANAQRIDAIRQEITRLTCKGDIDNDGKDLLRHDLSLAVNEVANIAGTYGYFRSSWNAQALKPLMLRPATFVATPGKHQVLQGEATDTLELFDGEAVYLDPPYTKRQYSGNYHVLETIARGDEPAAHGAGGLRDWTGQASDFCYRRRAPMAFERLLQATDAKHLFVSYSADGQVPIDNLASILSSYGRVERFQLELPRFRSNSKGTSGAVIEYLFHVEGK